MSTIRPNVIYANPYGLLRKGDNKYFHTSTDEEIADTTTVTLTIIMKNSVFDSSFSYKFYDLTTDPNKENPTKVPSYEYVNDIHTETFIIDTTHTYYIKFSSSGFYSFISATTAEYTDIDYTTETTTASGGVHLSSITFTVTGANPNITVIHTEMENQTSVVS